MNTKTITIIIILLLGVLVIILLPRTQELSNIKHREEFALEHAILEKDFEFGNSRFTMLVNNETDDGTQTVVIEGKKDGKGYRDISIETDPIIDVFALDMDANTYPEIYLITQSRDEGLMWIKAFSANQNRSWTKISYNPKIPDGYNGDDRFYRDGDKIIREFRTLGEELKLEIKLEDTETGLILLD